MQLVDRDYIIMRELNRWRFALGRHIQHIAGFPSTRTTDRRLTKLIQMGYIERKKVIYGTPSIYTLTAKGMSLINKKSNEGKIRIEQIIHDIAVLDTFIYYIKSQKIDKAEVITEKEMHGLDGFGVRKHQPDFIIKKTQTCVEVEISLKAKDRLNKIIENNFKEYQGQIWVVPSAEHKIIEIIEKAMEKYTEIQLMALEEVQKYVREINADRNNAE